MNKNKFFIITTIGLLVSNILLIGFLVMNKPGRRAAIGPKKMIISKLNFDDQQIIAFQKLIDQHRLAVDDIEDQVSNLKTTIYGKLGVGLSEFERDSLFQVLELKLVKRERIHFEHFEAIKEICTPAQLPAFAKLMTEVQGVFNRRKPRSKRNRKR